MVSKRLMKRLAEKFTNRCLIPNPKTKNITIHPVLLNKNQVKTSNDTILLSDELVKNALPEAYNIIEKEFSNLK